MPTVSMYVDELASCVSTPESEYESIEEDLRRHIFGNAHIIFKEGVLPGQVNGETIYVIDFGALSCYGSGFEWKADRLSRDLITAIDNNPDTIFILWSGFTARHYQYIACEDKGLDCLTDLRKPANVYLWDNFDYKGNIAQLDKIRQVLGLPAVTRRSPDDIFPTDEGMD